MLTLPDIFTVEITKFDSSIDDEACYHYLLQVGQHIGSLEYLLPTEYVETMKVLHSSAPKSPLENVYQVLREELECEVGILILFLFHIRFISHMSKIVCCVDYF